MDDELLRSSPLSSFLDGADDERAGVGGGMDGAETSGSAGVEAGSTCINLSKEGCKHRAWLITREQEEKYLRFES